MGIKKTLGGDRIGSGNRMKQELHNFFRSNHNLSTERNTSMANGVLYPIYTQVGLDGDTFDINLNAAMRTIPTQGMLFGKFKLQVDVYKCPVRLYQAILHNNTTEIGMNMNQVLMPKIKLRTNAQWLYDEETGKYKWKEQISRSSLLNYLGISGVGRPTFKGNGQVSRKFNAVPMLAYYDIFKNYYSNKQEENAYVIVSGESTVTNSITSTITSVSYGNTPDAETALDNNSTAEEGKLINASQGTYFKITGTNLVAGEKLNFTIEQYSSGTLNDTYNPNEMINEFFIIDKATENEVILEYIRDTQLPWENASIGIANKVVPKTSTYTEITGQGTIRLQEFPLSNIDEMRKRLLTFWELGEEVVIDENESLLPYQSVVKVEKNELQSRHNMQGLVVKTYQSDMYNNWLDTEWVNKITELSSVSTASGSFTIDALNFAKKVYNHYNRIAIAGGTYQDWQEATYGEKVFGVTEKPVYCGGMSAEVIFDEVVNSAATEDAPLGQLGGRGNIQERSGKGGKLVIKVNEPMFIMAIASLTPRVKYSQGNAWYATELDSIDDFHKPMFDRIGFQDLLAENMAWWDTQIDANTGNLIRSSVGKQPAWIHYMTDVDRVFGDFAKEDGKGFMTLQRLYDVDQENGGVADITTYIEPTKYNYAFAYNELDAQNFWGFFNFDIKARRKMSATQIPNL